MQETQVQSLDQEDPLETGMATHSSILAWRILWREEPGVGYSPWGCRVRHDLVTEHQLALTKGVDTLIHTQVFATE